MEKNAEQQGRISVFLLDDHEVVRRGVRDLLTSEPDIEVVGEAGTAESALARVQVLRPDVAVLDVRLPDGDGISVCREIRSKLPETACLMLTSYGDDQALLGAIMAGAAGYVLKQTCGSDLVSAVRTVAAGRSTLDAHATQRVMDRLRDRMAAVDPLSALSDQEKRLLGGGYQVWAFDLLQSPSRTCVPSTVEPFGSSIHLPDQGLSSSTPGTRTMPSTSQNCAREPLQLAKTRPAAADFLLACRHLPRMRSVLSVGTVHRWVDRPLH